MGSSPFVVAMVLLRSASGKAPLRPPASVRNRTPYRCSSSLSWKRSTDREQVIGVPKAAFVQGMLAKDEFDLRVGQRPRERGWGGWHGGSDADL